jgi:hypothetical protein
MTRLRFGIVCAILIGLVPAGSGAVGAIGPRCGAVFAVSGIVRAAGEDAVPSPIVVRLIDRSGSFRAEATADVAGRFTFENVPNGRYSISASTAGYVGLPYGAKYVQGLEVPIAVDDADVADLRLELYRTGTITGTVRDRLGAPMTSVSVSVQRWSVVKGWRILVPAVDGRAPQTDSAGRYRAEGLPPGEYVVSVAPYSLESQRGTKDVYLETYHPAAIDASGAAPVRVQANADVGGIDINLSLTRTSVIAGRIVVPAGLTVRRVILWARPKAHGLSGPGSSATVTGDAFHIPSLLPGEYVIEARATLDAGSGQPASGWTHWGTVDALNPGSDVADVQIVLNPTTSFSGVLVLDGPARPQPAPSVRVLLLAEGQPILHDVPTGTVSARGTFAIPRVTPGSYWFTADVPAGWALKSLRDEDRKDFTDVPLPVLDTETGRTFTVTYTTSTAVMEGTVFNTAGQPTYERAVVVFPQGPAQWASPDPRIRAVRPDTRGQFVIPGLPEGAYFVTTFDDRIDGEWMRSEFLRDLATRASRLTMPSSGVVVHDIRLAR